MLPLPTEAFQCQETGANSTLKTSLNEQPENASSECCSIQEKDEKPELKGSEQKLEKAALAPRNTFASKYHEMPFVQEFVTENTTESELFWVAAWSLREMPQMLCQYPRKHTRTKSESKVEEITPNETLDFT